MSNPFAFHIGDANPVSRHLHGRSFLKELDFTVGEWQELLKLARQLKQERRMGGRARRLVGRTIVLVFEKASTRTRCAFEVAAHEQGAHLTYLDASDVQLGHAESIRDRARVFGRLYDGIGYLGPEHSAVEQLAEASGVPVWNGRTDQWDPTQSLCDMLTMTENCVKPPQEMSFAYVGDARTSLANSLVVAGALMGMEVRMVSPAAERTSREVWEAAERIAAETGASIRATTEVEGGVAGVDFVYTDRWLSLGAAPDQAENRLHAVKAVLVATLGRLTCES